MITKQLHIQILFELLTTGLNETNLKQLIKKSLTTLLKKLNCSAGAIYFEDKSGNSVESLTKVHSIPQHIEDVPACKNALYTLSIAQLDKTKNNSSKDKFPIIESINDEEHYYIYKLADLGYVIIIKNGKRLSDYYVHTLPIIFTSLSSTCQLIIQNQELSNAQKELKEYNLELLNSHKLNEKILKKMETTQQKLILSEKQYRSLYNNAAIGLYRTSVKGELLFANPALANMMGYDNLEEFKNLNVSQNGYVNSFQKKLFHDIMKHEGQVENFESKWKKKNGKTLYVRENAKTIKDENGKIVYYEGYVEDITVQKEAKIKLHNRDIKLRYLERFENLIMTLATGFVTISIDELDASIDKLLQKVGSFTEIDRTYLFKIDNVMKTMSNTHEWVAKGISAEKENLQDLPTSIFPWWMKHLAKNQIIHIEDLETMPEEAHNEKEILEEQDIKAIVVLPIFIKKELYGFIGFDSVKKNKKWDSASIKILEMVSILISNMLSRSKTILSLDNERDKYRTLFLDSPIALLEEDLSKLKLHIENLKTKGIIDFKKYLEDNDNIRELAGLVEIRWANKAALDLYEVTSIKEMSTQLGDIVPIASYPQLAQEFLNIISGKRKFSLQIKNLTSTGKVIELTLNWVVASRYKDSLSSTIVALIDITESLNNEREIKKSLKEKERLLSEIHHRVKNNMQMVSAMLELQTDYLNEDNAKESFIVASNRIQSMAIIHEKLYETKNFGVIDLKTYLSDLITSLIESYTDGEKIELEIEIEDISIEIDAAITCGLLLNELITNSLKHAFIGKSSKKKLKVQMNKQKNNKIRLIVQDNGRGLPDDFDISSTRSLGMQLINGFINELRGTLDINSKAGTIFNIEIEPTKKSR